MIINYYLPDVPAAPSVLTFTNETRIQLYWNPASMVSDDVGMITWYNIEFINESIVTKFSVPHPTATFDLTFLKPSTDYSVRMRAVSNVGRGLWSTWINITVNTTSSIIKDRNNISGKNPFDLWSPSNMVNNPDRSSRTEYSSV